MKNLVKILFYLALLAVVVVTGGAAAFMLWPSDSLARMIESAVEDGTGRKMTIEGGIERSLFPVLGVKMGRFSLANADWAESGPLVSADGAEVGVRTFSLLTGGLEITKIAVAKPEIRLEIAENGRRSWDLAKVDVETGAGGDLERAVERRAPVSDDDDDVFAVLVESIEVRDGLLRIVDHGTGGAPIEVSAITLDGSFASLEDDFVMNGSAVAQGRPANLDIKLASPAALSRGESAKLEAFFEADGASARIDGTLRAPKDGSAPEAKGALKLALDGDKKRTAWLRALLPAELEPLEAATIDGAFDVAEKGLDLTLDGRFGFRGEPTTLKGSAKAGAGWSGGGQPIATDFAVKNRLLDAGYKGTVQQTVAATPQLSGEYRLKAPDAQALIVWSGAPKPAAGSPNALLQSVDLAGAVDMKPEQLAAALTGSVGFNGKSVAVEAGARGGAGWDAGGELETNAKASAANLFTADWKGTVRQDAEAVKGDIRFASGALRAFFEWLGLGPIEAPAGTFQSVEFKTDLAVDPAKGALENLALKLDKSAVTGALSYDLTGDRPAVNATLQSDPIDIRPFTRAASRGDGARGGGGGSSGRGAAPSTQGWSKEPLDLGALHLVDADLDVRTKGLTTSVLKVGQSHVTAVLKSGKLDASVKEMALYGGKAVGAATIDGSKPTPAIALSLDIGGVALRPLLNDAASMDWLEGTGALKANITGVGVSQDALMRSLAGSASMDFRDGAIIGYNLAALVRNITSLGQNTESQKTDFSEMRASFQIDKGVARNSDLYMAGPLVRLTGQGQVDIGDQTIDYTVRPKAVASLSGQGGGKDLGGIVVPVRIYGPWSNTKAEPQLDAQDLINNVEVLLASPEGAGEFLKQLEKGGLEDVLKGVTGDTKNGGGVEGLLDGLFGKKK